MLREIPNFVTGLIRYNEVEFREHTDQLEDRALQNGYRLRDRLYWINNLIDGSGSLVGAGVFMAGALIASPQLMLGSGVVVIAKTPIHGRIGIVLEEQGKILAEAIQSRDLL